MNPKSFSECVSGWDYACGIRAIGFLLESGPVEADGDPESPLSSLEIRQKFHRFADPVLGPERSEQLRNTVMNLGEDPSLNNFNSIVYSPIVG